MKKTLFISCILIFIIHYSLFICNAQVDTTAMQIEVIERVAANKQKRTPVDSVHVRKRSPKRASWLALIPGAGQIYNKKYWKLPIVYGGLGSTGFLIYYYGDLTSIYRKEYVARVNGDVENLSTDPEIVKMPTETILAERNFFRRNMEICVAACVIVYALSILDASVDAHLFYYDVSDNLSLGVKPKIDYNPINRATTPSLALIVKF